MAVFQKTAQAEEDLIGIWLYIAQDNPTAADNVLDTFEKKGWLLAKNPKLGQERSDIAEDFRHLPVGRYRCKCGFRDYRGLRYGLAIWDEQIIWGVYVDS